MFVSPEGVALIKQVETLRLRAYPDSDGYAIGWGHNTPYVHPGTVITKEQAEEYLQQDLAWAEDAVNRLVQAQLTQNQFDALVAFVFNVGEPQFATSTVLRRLNERRFEDVPAEMRRWNKDVIQKNGATVVKEVPALTRRRQLEIALFMRELDSDQAVSQPKQWFAGLLTFLRWLSSGL